MRFERRAKPDISLYAEFLSNSRKIRLQKSYGPDTILLQGHTVTLTFKVETQMLFATRRLNMVIISVKYF